MKTLYTYDSETFALTGIRSVEDDVSLPFSTSIPPAVAGLNEVACFDESINAWSLRPDFRGKQGLNLQTGETVVISELGSWPDSLVPYEIQNEDGSFVINPVVEEFLRLRDQYTLKDGVWYQTRFTKKEFLLWCGLDKLALLNKIISEGNFMAKSVYDLVFASEYVDVADKDTIELVGMLASAEIAIFSNEDVARILKGRPKD